MDTGPNAPVLATGEALVVDDEAVVCRAYARQLEQAGLVCHSAHSYAEALSVFEREQRIELVVTDHGIKGEDTEAFVSELRARRPGVIIVGSSGRDCRAELVRVGIDRFLQKPWQLNELNELLSTRIAQCTSCNTPLPLRRPFAGEAGESWVCAFCGARYRAAIDRDAAPEFTRNVRRPEPR